MYEFHPYFTHDGSVGLYSPIYNDIYHSATGALTEAYEKFVQPINMHKLLKNDSIKILDICYGIGYNSKSFLNYFYKNFSQKKISKKIFQKNINHANNNIDTIHTNNISLQEEGICTEEIHTNNIKLEKDKKLVENCNTYNDTIYTNNILPRIFITAVDNDKILSFLSPFIKTGEKNIQDQNLDFDYEIVNKFLTEESKIKHNKIDNTINYLLLEQIVTSNPEILDNKQFLDILYADKYRGFFEGNIKGIFTSIMQNKGKVIPNEHKNSFLHNIYYKYVSNCYKKSSKVYPLNDVTFNLKNGDARSIILEDKNKYDVIFLDAFTPSKCPCLWSYEFFRLLYEHLNQDGIILTYSTSASIRSAMMTCGFHIGNIFNERENKFTGTIASKNKKLIKYELSEYDLGLLKTTAGIFYRDKNLNALNEAIIEERKQEVKSSNRISSSKYKRSHKEDKCYTM